jgi:hypothetical protein
MMSGSLCGSCGRDGFVIICFPQKIPIGAKVPASGRTRDLASAEEDLETGYWQNAHSVGKDKRKSATSD